MTKNLIKHTRILSIIGDIIKVYVPADTGNSEPATRLYDLAMIKDPGGLNSLAQVININNDQVSLHFLHIHDMGR